MSDTGFRRLRICDVHLLLSAALELLARKPYPAIEGMRNVQRLLKTQNPRIAEVNVEDLVDNRFIRKLDESGFFDRIYGK